MNRTGRIRNPVATSGRLLQRKINQFIPYLNSPILDIGAGHGQYTTFLKNKAYVVDCVEPDDCVKDPALQYGANHTHYNTGLMINVLHHLEEDPHYFLTHYLRLCDTLVIGELNGDSWLVRNYHRLLMRDEIGLHLSQKDLMVILDGFDVVDSWAQDLGPFPAVHLFAVIKNKEGTS